MPGVLYKLVFHHADAAGAVVYRGRVTGDVEADVEVRVMTSAESHDGWAATAALATSDDRKPEIERYAAVMTKNAVRRANREGLPPPRRIQRWRG